MPDAAPAPPRPTYSRREASAVINHVTRWRILRELAHSSSLMVSEIAQRTGEGLMSFPSSCRSLRKAGVVINPRIRLFEIVLQYFADKSNRTLDFGHCLLRMNPCGKWQ